MSTTLNFKMLVMNYYNNLIKIILTATFNNGLINIVNQERLRQTVDR